MDRSERQGLIAQAMQTPPSGPLSPKQQFQSQIRGLTGPSRHPQAQPELDAASPSRRHELHHVSTLRVQQKRNASALPSRGRVALSETSHNLHGSQSTVFTDKVGPDFSAEEREAWSKKSPRPTTTSTRSRHGSRAPSPPRQQPVKTQQLLLFPPPERLEPLPQPRKQARQPSLRQFEPLQPEADLERPKTSRGVPSQSRVPAQPWANNREQEAGTRQNQAADARSRTNHRSKFLEGSMNDRSVAVASSWYHDNTSSADDFDDSVVPSAHGADTESDATPRTSKQLPPTPAPPTAKKSIFRFGGGRSSEESVRAVEDGPKNTKERKGLRKSISIWSFHSLGDKIFGGSGSDAGSETSIDTITDKRGAPKEKKTGTVADIDILNERKRKAEEAYAQRFGAKKHKSNYGQSLVSTPVGVQANKRIVDEKRPKTPTLFHRKREQHTPGDHKRAEEAPEAHKRLSRRDLEKENQQLRSMLKESRSMTFARSTSLTSFDLQRISQENLIHGPVVMLSPGKKQGRRGEDIPPVPKLPDQGILVEMQNRSRLPRPDMDTEKENQGSFETIEEAEEGMEMGTSDGEVSIPGQWEWPEDVF